MTTRRHGQGEVVGRTHALHGLRCVASGQRVSVCISGCGHLWQRRFPVGARRKRGEVVISLFDSLSPRAGCFVVGVVVVGCWSFAILARSLSLTAPAPV